MKEKKLFLTPVKDAGLIERGDLLLIPTESGSRRKRLHLGSASSYGKMGLSVGHTCRSRNTVEDVKKIFSDTGIDRMFYCISVRECHNYTTRREDALLLATNTIAGTPTRPRRIASAAFAELPSLFSYKSDENYAHYLAELRETVVSILSGKIDESLLFRAESGGCRVKCPCVALEEAVSLLSDDYIGGLVPFDKGAGGWRTGNPMNRDDLVDFLTSSEAFSASNQCDSPAIGATPVFFNSIMQRGARIYRPSEEWKIAAASEMLVRAFTTYTMNCRKIEENARSLASLLRTGIGQTNTRIRLAKGLLSKIRLAPSVVSEISDAISEQTA